MPNELLFQPSLSTDFFSEDTVIGESTGYLWAGESSGTVRGALRVTNVTLNRNQSISRAGLVLRGGFSGSGAWKVKIYGMKTGDVATFGSGNPYGIYSKTTAFATVNNSSPNTGDDIDITSIINEIAAQGSWNTGQDMGFFIENDGSDTGRYYIDFSGGDETLLSIRITNPDLTPTPVTVAAPTFPSASDFGIKISKPGFDVKTATEAQLLFTTRKKYLKILAEGQVDTTAGVVYSVAHGLGYAPQAMAFARSNDLSFQLPRIVGSVGDPVGGGIQGILRVSSTHVTFSTSIDASVYYYIFLDEQAT